MPTTIELWQAVFSWQTIDFLAFSASVVLMFAVTVGVFLGAILGVVYWREWLPFKRR